MTKQFRYMRAQNPFIVGNTGASLDEARCEHGLGAVFVTLFGRHRTQAAPQERLDTLLPRCVLAELVGAVQAHIRLDEGDAAAEEFSKEIADNAAASLTALQELRARQRDCCEAGFSTDGREHTCGRNEATQ